MGSYTINVKYTKGFKECLKRTFVKLNDSIIEGQAGIKRQIADLNKKIERLEERYILEEISPELYVKYKAKFEEERDKIEQDIQYHTIELSRLDDYIDYSFTLSGNLSKMWVYGDYTQRQELQNSFFEGASRSLVLV
jgi:hypothetical protein